jgi:hypothetical protein
LARSLWLYAWRCSMSSFSSAKTIHHSHFQITLWSCILSWYRCLCCPIDGPISISLIQILIAMYLWHTRDAVSGICNTCYWFTFFAQSLSLDNKFLLQPVMNIMLRNKYLWW